MAATSHLFKENARRAMLDERLQGALDKLKAGFRVKRREAMARLPEFDALRDAARDVKDHTLAHLDLYLEAFEAQVRAQGGHVHWCRDAAEARQAVLDICRRAGARTVTKGKSMVAEEVELNPFLERNGIEPVETDLGEYIIQLRREPPSHIIAPAIHLRKDDVAQAFRRSHEGLAEERSLEQPRELLDEARAVLRERFLAADVGITGANFLIAENGASVIVTNEGNGDLTQILPRVHVVLTGIEKVVPTMEDATTLLRVLARSATGQEFTSYVTFSAGPRRADDPDGPEEFHVVLLDNGRSALLGGPFRDALRCIRCAACLNHCPIYANVGGHAYGWVYSGPIGAVLTPAFVGLEEAVDLPNASSLCGRCEEVCPVRIPLPRMLREWRTLAFGRRITPARERWGLALWGWLAARPRAYRAASALAAWGLARLTRRKGALERLPFAKGWTAARDLPAPEGRTFMNEWRRGRRR